MIENLTADAYSIESLQWLIEAGADEAIGDVAVNRFETSAKAQLEPIAEQKKNYGTSAVDTTAIIQSAQNNVKGSSTPLNLGANDAINMAKKICASISKMDDLKKAIKAFDGCPSLKNTARNSVIIKGLENAPTILCIGHAPNRDDETQSTPFSGNSEVLLNRMFNAIDIPPEQIAYTNSVFWSPPGKRSINPAEFSICKIFIDKIITLLSPKMIVLFGGEATKNFLKITGGISKLHGTEHTLNINGTDIPCIPLHHPDYILETPMIKPSVWQDLKKIKQLLS